MAENFTETVNMNGVDTLTAYFDNTLTGIQLPSTSDVDDIDLLEQTFNTEPETSSEPEHLHRSPSDLDLENYSGPEGLHFEEIPSLASESDTDLSYHSSSSDHDESHDEHSAGQKKYRQPASLRAVNLTIGPWVS